MNCCGTVRLNMKVVPENLRHKTVNLRKGDIRVRTRGDLTAIQLMDKRNSHMLTFMIHYKKEIPQ
jgi:hypothetical protein